MKKFPHTIALAARFQVQIQRAREPVDATGILNFKPKRITD
jgi:hypothetical protein